MFFGFIAHIDLSIIWLSNLLTESTWWGLFQSFDRKYLMRIVPIFWLKVPDEDCSNLLTESTWWGLFQSFDWKYLMRIVPIFWLKVPDEDCSNLLTESTWWGLFQSFDWKYLMRIVPETCCSQLDIYFIITS